MPKVMVTIQSPTAPPSIDEVRDRYQLAEDEIDLDFGVVEIDPQDHLYTILVDEAAAAKIVPSGDWEVSGPFSNPRIEPFGPPDPEEG